jgi:hypothetical protein
LEKSVEILNVIFVTNNQAPKVKESDEHAFNFPTASISSQRPTILSLFAFGSIGRDHLRAEILHQLSLRTAKPNPKLQIWKTDWSFGEAGCGSVKCNRKSE